MGETSRSASFLAALAFASVAALSALVLLALHGPQWLVFALLLAAGLLPWCAAVLALRAQRKVAGAEAAKWSVYLQQIIDASSALVYVRDAQGRFVLVNESFAADRNKTRVEMLGGSYAVSADSLEEDRRVLAGEEIAKEEWRVHPLTGKEVCRKHVKRVAVGVDGKLIVIGTSHDITDLRLAQRDAQQALERERARVERIRAYLQRLIDVIPQPMYVKDAQGRYIMVNDAFVSWHGVPREEVIGAAYAHPAYARLLGESSVEELARKVAEEDTAVLEGLVVLKEESRQHTETGEELHRLISKRACVDEEGRKVIVGANFDITSWRVAERRAEEGSRAKSMFLAAMSHEIRTPLTGVLGMLRKVMRARDIPAAHHESLGIALSSAESLLAIINDILDFSKIEAGQMRLESIDFELRVWLDAITKPFMMSAREAGLDFVLEVDAALPEWIRGDPTRMRQVLVNLLGNALKFTASGGIRVAVSLATYSSGIFRIRCEVIDSGIGIAASALPRLFSTFQQAEDSTARKFGGTGLGLAISRHLVEAMGGEIGVLSEEGRGSTFHFELPCERGEPQRQAFTPRPAAQRSLRVLCADDEPLNQMVIGDLLLERGHMVTMVGDGLQAVQTLAREDFDLVLMDGQMPNLDGRSATRLIRAGGNAEIRVRNPHVMIVAFTANACSDDHNESLACGMNDILLKPVDEEVLERVLSAADAARADEPAQHEAGHGV